MAPERTLNRGPAARRAGAPCVLSLDDPLARDASVSGAKAAVLARASALGLPVLPGIVLVVGSPFVESLPELRTAWEQLTDAGSRPVAVRSSSTIEDQASSSMAGQFHTELDVRDWGSFVQAVGAVRDSGDPATMGVLIQPMLDAARGGVVFGVDPVSGRSGHLVAEVVPGNPSALVDGSATGVRFVLGRRGRLIEADPAEPGVLPDRRGRRDLAALASVTAAEFGGPQDIEWAVDHVGRTWLLQARPVTAVGATPAAGPLLGPGPVAETLPEALSPLEEALWAEPLRDGVTHALDVLGVVGRRRLRASPVVAVVDGRVAADLSLLDPAAVPRGRLAWLDPRPPARRLGASWRVGRLRRAMPLLAADLVTAVDAELHRVPPLARLDNAELASLLRRTTVALRAVHGHEVLAGALLSAEQAGGAAAAGLAALREGRREGLDDDALLARRPEVLALTAPRIGPRPVLPATPSGRPSGDPTDGAPLGAREALRMRARWLQELGARAAWALGCRLAAAGKLPSPTSIGWLRAAELDALVRGASPPADLAARAARPATPPLPSAFRLGPDGQVVAEASGTTRGGRGAGGGRGVGCVGDGPGTVLVVRTLEPGLAAQLPGRAGLVAETGSVLSHLAILARELGIPTVVAVADAVERFPSGTTVLVDGGTGEVTVATT